MSNLLSDIAARAGEHAGWAGGGGGPWWVLFPLMGIVLVVTLIWLVVRRREPASGAADRPVEILAARYARGEIDTEEYRRRLDEIRGLA